LLSADSDFLRAVMDVAVQAVLEVGMTEALSAEKSPRVDGRQGYRSGYCSSSLTTRVGTLERRVSRDRSGLLSGTLATGPPHPSTPEPNS
jgi:putative transposase